MRSKVLWALALVSVAAVEPASTQPSPPWAAEKSQVSQRDLETVVSPSPPQTLDLKAALQLGFANNAAFRSQIAALLQVQADLRVARQFHSLTLFGSTERDHQSDELDTTETNAQALLGVDFATGGTVSVAAALDLLDSAEGRALSLELTQPLLRGAGRAAPRYEALRSAHTAYRRALLEYFLARQDVALRIITGYFGAVQAKQQVAIQEQGLDRADRAVKDAEARLAEGMTTRIEVARAQLSEASSRLALNTAKLAYLDQMDAFLQTLGLQVGTVPELTTQPIYKPVSVEIEALVQQGLQDRAEMAIASLGVEDAEAALRISRNSRKPALDLFGSSTHLANGESSTGWSVGVMTSIPVGSRALNEAVRSAERSLLLTQRNLEQLRQSITTQVRDQVRGLQSKQERIEILEKSVEIAREKLRLADISVEEGIGIYRDKIEAQEELTAAESDLVSAQINYFFGVLSLRRAVGQDVLQGLEQEITTTSAPPAALGAGG